MEKLKPEYTFTDELKTKVECILSQLKQETPEAFEDGQINFDILKDLIGAESIDDDTPEHFGLNWPGKRQARRLASLPPKGTLKPCIGEGINEETTENIFIEGENLEVLKILRKSYKGKIKMIYIDPPYNTGNDFIYKDDFSEPLEDYLRKSGQKSEEGLLTTNPKSQGRYHSNWLNFMYPRLRLAKDLLSDDGVIFVSIDDNEAFNLTQVLNEVFGEENRLGTIIWKKKTNGNNMGHIPPIHDFIFVYSKNNYDGIIKGFPVEESYIEQKYSNPDNDPNGPWTITDLSANHKGPFFGIKNPITKEEFFPPDGRYWVFNENEVKKRIEEGKIIFGKNGTSRPVQKKYLSERKSMHIKPDSIWDNNGLNSDGTLEIGELFVPKIFDNPKPTKLLIDLLSQVINDNDIVLDFFAGSGSTAHALLKYNVSKSLSNKFICIQIPEPTDENSVAYTNGFKFISELTKERIKRVINIFNNQTSEFSRSLGFKCYKLDYSNIKEWQDVQPLENRGINLFSQLEQQNQQPIHENTKTEDLITEFMLVEGFPLHSKISKLENVDGNTVFKIMDSEIPYSLFVCLDDMIQPSTVEKLQIASKDTFICLDRSFNGNDQVKMRLDDICKLKTV